MPRAHRPTNVPLLVMITVGGVLLFIVFGLAFVAIGFVISFVLVVMKGS